MKCILHIGTEKTATTLLQQWLYDNERMLSKHGVALTTGADAPNNIKLVSSRQYSIDDYMKRNNVHSPEERERFFSDFDTTFGRELKTKANKCGTVLLTSEHFHSRLSDVRQIQSIKRFLDQYFTEFQVICYFREQSKVRTSLYSTGLKVGGRSDVRHFQPNITVESHYYNYLVFFEKWEEVFGREALTPRIFDTRRFVDEDIRVDFLSLILPQVDKSEFDFNTKTANEALNQKQAFFFRLVNRCKPLFVGRFVDPTPELLRTAISEAEALADGDPLFDPRQPDFYRMFDESNRAFFRRYFGADENLFDAPTTAATSDAAALTLKTADVEGVLTSVLRRKNLIALQPEEIDMLRDLALALLSRSAISRGQALDILRIAGRARPDGEFIARKIEELSAAEETADT